MPIWKLQVEAAGDSILARDMAVITPHFNDSGVGTDPQGLCDELATAMAAYYTGSRQVEVTAYDAQGTVPVEPQGYAIRNVNGAPASFFPREVALCLSFYSGTNRPRYRGRLYLPLYAIHAGSTSSGRPTLTVTTKVSQLAPILQDVGGPDVDWCVYSRAMDEANPVTNWWVDDEWDTVRSRGQRPTTRLTGTTSEA